MSWYHLKGKDFINTTEWDREELDILLDVAADLKRKHYSRVPTPTLAGKSFFMLFFNDSTRTRHSFETGMTQLGGHAQYVRPENMRLTIDPVPTGKGESIKDTAEVLSRFGDGIGIRLLASAVPKYGGATEIVREFARHASIPVINMMSDFWHPCQAMTDIMTLREKTTGGIEGKKLVVMWAYSPHARDWASAQETAMLAARYGINVTIAHPPGYDLVPEVIERARDYSRQTGTEFGIANDLEDALRGADFVYPRNWVTLQYHERGKEEENRLAEKYKDWKFTRAMRDRLTNKAKLIHCMPIDRGNEAENDLIDDVEVSWLYDQAENRLHLQKALMTLVMGGRP